MNQEETTAALGDLRDAREKWHQAQVDFRVEYNTIVRRLIYEALANFMGAAHIASALGISQKSVRALMRGMGLDPRAGQRVLNAKASDAMLENAALMGIDPKDMDLTSPLAYLPMGKDLRRQLEDRTVRNVDPDDESVSGNASYETAKPAIHASLYAGIAAEEDWDGPSVKPGDLTNAQVEWIASWLAGDGFVKQPKA
jgi:hypothetical protein